MHEGKFILQRMANIHFCVQLYASFAKPLGFCAERQLTAVARQNNNKLHPHSKPHGKLQY